jgi:excisionase family DNA binding protein
MPGRKTETAVIVVPVLEGWLTALQAAEVLGISRQSVARMMNEGTFRTLHAVGDRPLYVIHRDEVERYLDLFDELGAWSKAAEALKKEKFKV